LQVGHQPDLQVDWLMDVFIAGLSHTGQGADSFACPGRGQTGASAPVLPVKLLFWIYCIFCGLAEDHRKSASRHWVGMTRMITVQR